MPDRPIIFSAPMVRALLAGRKTQTRRLAGSPLRRCAAGDRLYVREHWRVPAAYDDLAPSKLGGEETVLYAAGAGPTAERTAGRHRQGMHMPRWASRLTLLVDQVRVEQLQALTERDAEAEGCVKLKATGRAVWQQGDQHFGATWPTCRAWYADLWDSLHLAGVRWVDDPAVVVLTFRVVRDNIDQVHA